MRRKHADFSAARRVDDPDIKTINLQERLLSRTGLRDENARAGRKRNPSLVVIPNVLAQRELPKFHKGVVVRGPSPLENTVRVGVRHARQSVLGLELGRGARVLELEVAAREDLEVSGSAAEGELEDYLKVAKLLAAAGGVVGPHVGRVVAKDDGGEGLAGLSRLEEEAVGRAVAVKPLGGDEPDRVALAGFERHGGGEGGEPREGECDDAALHFWKR